MTTTAPAARDQVEVIVHNNPSLLSEVKTARSLLSTPEKWAKGAFTKISLTVDPKTGEQKATTARCVMSALPSRLQFEVCFAFAQLVLDNKTDGATSLIEYNDAPRRTHADILHFLDYLACYTHDPMQADDLINRYEKIRFI